MKPHKVRFTVWLDPAALEAAKARARQDGGSVSEALSQAATESLLRNRQDAEAQIAKAVERVFYLVQRTDRRRSFDQQVLKEMLGLAVLSFFNHTPAVPEANKKAALLGGKARFHRFLDTLAANLRGGKSILSDLPAQREEAPAEDRTQDAIAEIIPAGRKTTDDHGVKHGHPATKTGDVGMAIPSTTLPEPSVRASADAPHDADGPVGAPHPEPKRAEPERGKNRWGLFG